MRSRRLLVLLLLALSGLGWAAAHALAHRLVSPAAMPGMPSVEGYLAYLPVSLALCMALALPLAAGVVCGARWKGASVRSLWLFGVVPVLGFVGHTFVEPFGAGPTTVFATSAAGLHLAPVALVGLLLQIPFALAAVALGRRLFAFAEIVARWLVGPRAALRRATAGRQRADGSGRRPPFRLELSRAQRAPPSPVLT